MISYLLSTTYKPEHCPLYVQVPHLTRTIQESYDSHFTWLEKKFFANLRTGGRGYVFATSGMNLAGCSLLKNEEDEKKICCLFVDPEFRRLGIASKLIENSFEILQTEHPLITVSEQNLQQLIPLLKRYGFVHTSTKNSVYKPGVNEYYYNEGLAR